MLKRFLIPALLSLSPASSQGEESTDLMELSLEELLDMEVVSATISPKKLNTVPASVTIFNSQEINNMGLSTLEELLNFAPGYQSAKRGDSSLATPYSARGRAIGTSTSEVIVLLDGRRIDNATSGGQSSSIPGLSLANIETVEFLRGPASSLYGSNAFLGVINLTSSRERNDLSVSIGSHRTVSAQANFSQSNAQGLTVSLHANLSDSDGESFRLFNNFTDQQQLARTPHQTVDVDLHFSLGATSLSLLHAERKNDSFLIAGNLSPEINRNSRDFSMLSFEHALASELFDSLKLSAGLKAQETFTQTQTTPFGALASISQPSSDQPVILKAKVEEYEPWFRLDGSYASNSNQSIVFGIEYRNPQLEPNGILGNYDIAALSQSDFPVDYYQGEFLSISDSDKRSDDIFGTYFQFENTFANSDTLTLGFRYDDFSYASARLSPRVAYVHPFLDSAFLKLVWGEAYRTPKLSERVESTNNVQTGNSALKPETVTTTELILGGNWRNAYASVSLFENTFRDAIVQTFVDDIRTFRNAHQESSSGIEAETFLQLGEHSTLRLSATHFFDLPQSSFRDSRNLASLSYNRSAENWNINLGAVYHSSQRNPSPVAGQHEKLPGYATVNATFSYRIRNSDTISLKAHNAFDKTYYTASQSILPGGAPNPGRSLTATYTIRW
ncbi:TonB-dependent receptor [Pelagicoccus enzymogenes]|uniref:TonB-dependent receptor plug domain-containing protein n=1 Tax=Pelagicoccus enzymogenes TaxID=2773457 RepID=UPI00280D34AA|nr:TonB-dependent receptor [Pelagicoccus enzymogenes]MDQ8196642.1 TonB-dependent receptor [Pelagicoccus enzymogenes]